MYTFNWALTAFRSESYIGSATALPDNIQSLQELRDLASRKRFSAIKQKKISDYIPTT